MNSNQWNTKGTHTRTAVDSCRLDHELQATVFILLSGVHLEDTLNLNTLSRFIAWLFESIADMSMHIEETGLTSQCLGTDPLMTH